MIVEMAYVQLWLEGSGPQLIVTSLSCWGASLKLLVAVSLADSMVLAGVAGSKSLLMTWMTWMTGLSEKPMSTEYILPSGGPCPMKAPSSQLPSAAHRRFSRLHDPR